QEDQWRDVVPPMQRAERLRGHPHHPSVQLRVLRSRIAVTSVMVGRSCRMRAAVVACVFSLPLACARAESEPRAAGTTEGPLVLELFTSQGCSSCPPADRLLSKLSSAGALGDRAVAPLSFHVDYWNDGGWADPYSLPAWTERQRQYARALADNRV